MRAPLWVLASVAVQVSAAHGATMLIRDATVHTVSAAGVLAHTDIIIRDGRVAELGAGLTAPPDAEVIDAGGRPVTPGLFGGVGHLGIEEIGLEPTVDDYALNLGAVRPEFDVTPAFNPDSAVLGVARLGGVTFAQLAPSSEAHGEGKGGSIISGQGAIVRLDGAVVPVRALFIETGGVANALSGGSRAAQFMLLQQALTEVHAPELDPHQGVLGLDAQRPLQGCRRLLIASAARLGARLADERGRGRTEMKRPRRCRRPLRGWRHRLPGDRRRGLRGTGG